MAKSTIKEKRNMNHLRSTAEDFFIRLGMPAKEISGILEVSEQTLTKWKKGREGEKTWEERKNEMQLTPIKVKEILLGEAMKLAKGEKTLIEADKLSKVVAAIEKLDRKINVRVIFDVLKEFDNWMADVEPVMAVDFLRYHKMFLQHRITQEAQ